MAKKSFRENPALQFISIAQETEAPSVPTPAPEAPPPKTGTSVPVKMDPRYVETKSRRLQLLVRPSLYSALKKRAQQTGVSVNEWVHEALERAVEP